MSEKVLELKAKGEALMKAFNDVVKEIDALGFKVLAQPNLTMYVFKDIREAYGELIPQPQPNKVVKLPQQGEANAG